MSNSNKNEKVILLYEESEKSVSIFPVDSRKLVKNNNFLVNKRTCEARDQTVDMSHSENTPAFAPNSSGMNFGT